MEKEELYEYCVKELHRWRLIEEIAAALKGLSEEELEAVLVVVQGMCGESDG